MKHRTNFHPEARAELRKLPRSVAMTVLRKLSERENDPNGYGTTALVSRPDIRRLRVGYYRVFYTVGSGELVVYVVAVAHRSTAYWRPGLAGPSTPLPAPRRLSGPGRR